MLRAAVIGLGNVGADFVSKTETLISVQNHAAAYALHPEIQLVAGCSPDEEHRSRFSSRYGCPAFSQVEEMLEQCQPQVVSICSPTPLHLAHVEQCLAAGVQRIWLEKPPAVNLSQLLTMRQQVDAAGARVVVHYLRRYAAWANACRQVIQAETLGKLLGVQLTYSRGLLTNGSHFLDLAFYLLGDSAHFQVVAVDDTLQENPSALLRLGEDIPVSLSGLPVDYHNLDLSLTFQKGRLSLMHGGMTMRWEDKIPHPLFDGFFILQENPHHSLPPGGFDGCFARALDDLLAHDTPPVSGLSQATKTQELLNALLPS
ncbi:MAG: Gfo/Idh/MocA family oxidoreductase [Magnetococcales bacterium]|nr:Gfo/Idh/MocA family oxidoreductase [Magnetococcales bacterium]NGZ27885.1 Gfo/Idh/MocA family oxidoreductase [Magnetococcales bacterium]